MTDIMADRKADIMAPEGTPFRRVRLDDDIWERFEEAVKRADPDSNRSAILRRFIRWYIGDIGELPQRPAAKRDGAK